MYSERIKIISEGLKELNIDYAFVGGSIIPLYSQKPVLEPRFTLDIDVVVEIVSYLELSKIEEQLLRLKFSPDQESGKICRYIYKGIIVDIMPIEENVFGFVNKWYEEGLKNSIYHFLDEKYKVKIFSAPYCIATKLEAFKDRGKGDGRTSHDFEDIVFILENRPSIFDELKSLKGEISKYLKDEFTILLKNPSINEWIDSHVERNNPPATNFIIKNLRDTFFEKTIDKGL